MHLKGERSAFFMLFSSLEYQMGQLISHQQKNIK